MAEGKRKLRTYHLRVPVQIIAFLLSILGAVGVSMTGAIYPFFFCPASPGACAGCPIWVMEHGTLELVSGYAAGASMFLYLIGLFLIIGTLVGRSFCGWACPVGALQDLFSFLKRKVLKLLPILAITGGSILLISVGIIVPHLLSNLGHDINTYMWAGYLGAFGAFGGAISGVLLIERYRGWTIPFLLAVIGAVLWAVPFTLDLLKPGRGPFESVELMGTLGLMAITVSVVGFLRISFRRYKIKDLPQGIDRYSRLIKVGILVLIPLTTWYFDTLAFTDIDPIGGITATIPELFVDPLGWEANQFFWYKTIFVMAFIGLVVTVDRSWCRYLCPIGAMYGPMNLVAVTDIEFDPSACIHCQRCIIDCPMGINPKSDKRDPECIRCGRCIDSCPTSAQRFRLLNGTIRGIKR